MLDPVLALLEKQEIVYETNALLCDISSMGIGGAATIIAYPDTEHKLCDLVAFLHLNIHKYLIIGRATNLLFSDEGYDGVVISTEKLRGKSLAENILTVQCGASLGGALMWAARYGLGGGEALVHIPAAVGGALYMCAGAYERSISTLVRSVRAFDPEKYVIRLLSPADMCFAYRDSIFQHEPLVVLSAELELAPRLYEDIVADVHEFARRRRNSQPLDMPSLGSVFKRVGNIGAGFYIERAGLKGTAIGGAVVSQKHAGFIVNSGGAKAKDVKALIGLVKARVREHFGVELVEEIIIC